VNDWDSKNNYDVGSNHFYRWLPNAVYTHWETSRRYYCEKGEHHLLFSNCYIHPCKCHFIGNFLFSWKVSLIMELVEKGEHHESRLI